MQQDVMVGLGQALGRAERGIKIHGPEAFAGMRAAGLLAAETLDYVTPYVRPGVTTDELDRLCYDFVVERGGDLGAAQLPRLSEIDLHLDQPRRLPRHPRRPPADGGRHPQYRRDPDARRLARRLEPHVPCRRAHPGQGEEARRRDLRSDDARHRRGQAGRSYRRDRRRDPALRRGQPLFGGARFLRPRHRPRLSRRTVDPALRQPRATDPCCARACSSPSSR